MASVVRRSSFPFAFVLLVPAAIGLMPGLAAQVESGSGAVSGAASTANTGVDANAMAEALNALQPTFSEVSAAVSGVDVHRWKVPGEVKDTTNSDIQSIERDLNGTLPALVSQAQASPGNIAPVFAVFRNIDALYDVLLRVTETATLAGSKQEATQLEAARADLQLRRSQLGNALLTSASVQDTNVTQLRNSLDLSKRGAADAQTAGPKKIVVNDGPDPTAKTVKKRKPAPAKPTTPAANSAPPQQ